jgi:dihydrofolate reductase
LAPIDLKQWQEVARTHHARTDDDTADFSYVTYRRHSRGPRPV